MAMTQAVVCHSATRDSAAAARHVAGSVEAKLGGRKPDVLILFASPEYDYAQLLPGIQELCSPGLLVGCSSAGEFSGRSTATPSLSAIAIIASDIRFRAGVGIGLRGDRQKALEQVLPVFTQGDQGEFLYRSALVLTDALAGHTDELIHDITMQTAGTHQLFGGGAADDARFRETHVFFGPQAYADAVVVLEMLSKKPVGIGVRHGWIPASDPLRVTEARGNVLVSLNAIAAADVFAAHALRRGQHFDRGDPLPFFLHNVIGIDTGDGYKLRVPLSLSEDGSISCAAEIPVGATVRIMAASVESACEAARTAASAAIRGLQGATPAASLLFDCAATRLRLGSEFGGELNAVAEALGSQNFAGCNTYGQIVRAEGQFSAFHHCTAIVCAIPQ